MKILIVNKFHYRRGGDCVYTLALAELLRSAGHDVAHFSMRHPANLPCAQASYFVSHIDFAQLNAQKNPLNALRVLWRSIYSVEARIKIRCLISDFKPDVAHLQNIHSYITPSILVELERARIPVLWTLHDYKLICPEDSFLSHGRICEACKGKRFYQCTVRRCKKGSLGASLVASLEAYVHQLLHIPRRVFRFISPSRFLRDKHIEFGWPERKISAIPNFLPDLNAVPVRHDGTYGLYIGSLRPIKGVRTLLTALAQIPDAPFHIVGDGPERESLQAMAEKQGLRHVEFKGFLTGAELHREVENSAFGVIPSECYENYPYAAMEMMAAGKAVIASSIGGLPEMIEHEVNGLLFEPGCVEALTRCMVEMYTNLKKRIALGQAGRSRAEELFAAKHHRDQIERTYKEAIETS